MARFQAGETQAFDALVRRYERELYGYLRRYVGDGGLAEDVFQNTFLQLYLKSGHYESGRRVRPWLYTIATHQAVDALRRNGASARRSVWRPPAKPPTTAKPTAWRRRWRGITRSRSTRPPDGNGRAHPRRRRTAARLPPPGADPGLLPGLKYREVAEALGIPVGTVKSRLHAALVKLQESMAATTAVYEA